jgi:hypothetical protein
MHRFVVAALAAALALSGCKSKDEILRAAEEKAQLEAEKKARMAKGIGEALSGAGQEASEALGKGVGDVLKGAERGVDRSGLLDVRVAADVAQLGLKVERGERGGNGDCKSKVVQLYLVYDRAVKQPLELRAFDAAGRELGRARATLADEAAGAAYLDFGFDERAPISVIDHLELVRR